MKHFTLHLLILFAIELSVTVSEKADVPDSHREELKWDIDLNDMLNFKNPFRDHEDMVLGEKIDKRKSHIEDELLSLNKYVLAGKMYKKLQEQTNEYIKRYVNLFLVKCDLKDKQGLYEDLTVDLVFYISREDLNFLQNLSKTLNQQNTVDFFNRLDEIIDKGFQRKEEDNLFEKLLAFVKHYAQFINIPPSWYQSKIFYYILIPIVTVIITALIKHRRHSTPYIILTVINNYIILEGVLQYVNKVKEGEAIDYARMVRVSMDKDACNPSRKSLWSSITEWFTGDPCLHYQMALTQSKAEEVSLLECMVNTYCYYLFQIPSKVLGSSIHTFSANVNASMPLGWLFSFCTNSFIVLLIFTFVVILLLRPHMRFSFLGAGLDVGFTHRIRGPPTDNVMLIDGPRIQEIRGSESEKGVQLEGAAAAAANDSNSDKVTESDGGKSEAGNVEKFTETETSLLKDFSKNINDMGKSE